MECKLNRCYAQREEQTSKKILLDFAVRFRFHSGLKLSQKIYLVNFLFPKAVEFLKINATHKNKMWKGFCVKHGKIISCKRDNSFPFISENCNENKNYFREI